MEGQEGWWNDHLRFQTSYFPISQANERIWRKSITCRCPIPYFLWIGDLNSLISSQIF